MLMSVGLALTPGGSTEFRGYSSDWSGAGISARRTPSNLGQKLCPMANTLSLRGLNGITPSSGPWLGGDADVWQFWFRLQGVRLDSEVSKHGYLSRCRRRGRFASYNFDMTSDDEAAEKPEQGEPDRELHEHEQAPDKPEAKRPWSFIGRPYAAGIPFIKKPPQR